ncbi:Xanthine and CO dehydrogenases maturation factor, XdhC/CoxF family [hydrothermal vent metagenome]|uniref:Xanthine and CO dehydrogenases maturation factor, XdhC/CoxF family n=1 Tax=hydrothermal vent metagenome TaxID=652676 RepID=A0A3B0U2D3_9ZZZZ
MVMRRSEIAEFTAKNRAILVRTEKIYGSTPREAGAFMLVGEKEEFGTIGGGQLEYIAIDKARQMLRNDSKKSELDVPLGSEIGQCCGGKVFLSLQMVDDEIAAELQNMMKEQEKNLPHVYIFGAGHVGRALAVALKELPLRTIIIDEREKELALVREGIECRLSALPEVEINGAPPNSSFVILTHDHGLDFLLARQALERKDAYYVGMIGSKTKRAVFSNWMKKHVGQHGAQQSLVKSLICPIGGGKLNDKRPQIIAAMVAAEILMHTDGRHEITSGQQGSAYAQVGGKI